MIFATTEKVFRGGQVPLVLKAKNGILGVVNVSAPENNF